MERLHHHRLVCPCLAQLRTILAGLQRAQELPR